MEILLWFQTISNSWLDILFRFFSFLGEEYFIILIFCFLEWCGYKSFAHKTGFAFCMGMGINQILKIIFCVPRPWVLDSRIVPSQNALENATGYSFPSGHTQSGVTALGCVAKDFGKKTFKILCITGAVGVGISRMYFRVHTPWDVAVSFVIGIGVIFLADVVYSLCEKHDITALATGILLSAFTLAFPLVKSYPDYHIAEYSYDCIKIAGAIGGFVTGWFLERRYVKYNSNSPAKINVIKTLAGVVVLIATKLFFDIFPEDSIFIMYTENFVLILWCILIYPFILKTLKK